MARFSQDFPDKVKDSIDIIDVISEYVQLKRAGKNYKGLCPFHQEKTPSFTVNPENQFYYCFGCGAGGDVFSFIMEIEHITFYESLKVVAQKAGIELPDQNNYNTKVNKEREKYFKIYELTAKFYHYLLVELDVGVKAVEYLSQRGFSQDDIERYNLGYAPDRWRALFNFLSKKGYDRDELVKAGLIMKSKNNRCYDRFRGRVIFPIYNIRGEVLAFGGRIIEEAGPSVPKYLNSPDSLIYHKGDILYGLNWARSEIRKKDSAIIMEGYTDVLTAHKKGIKNAVASLGTALTEKQAKLLNRYASVVYIAYDADTAGGKATLRGLDLLKNVGLRVKVIDLPEDRDPDDFIQENGLVGFEKLQQNALSLIDFKIKQITGNRDRFEADEKIRITRRLIDLLSSLNDPIERDVYINKVGKKFNIDTLILKKEIQKARQKVNKSNKKDKNYKNRYTKNVNKTNSSNSIIKLEEKILQTFIDYPEYRKDIIEKVDTSFFSEKYQKAVKVLWKHPELSLNKIIDNFVENDEVKGNLMAIMVKENIRVSRSLLKSWLIKLINNNKFKDKLNIYNILKNGENINLGRLNDLLIKFKELDLVYGREGI